MAVFTALVDDSNSAVPVGCQIIMYYIIIIIIMYFYLARMI